MPRVPRLLVAAAACAAVAVSLTGCSILEPTRDAEGRVVAPLDARASQLRVGDCFVFQDEDDLSRVTIVPCAQPHSHLVIDQGEATPARIKLAGGLQNALSVLCAPSYQRHLATLPEGAEPEQEFLASMVVRDGYDYADYSCVVAAG